VANIKLNSSDWSIQTGISRGSTVPPIYLVYPQTFSQKDQGSSRSSRLYLKHQAAACVESPAPSTFHMTWLRVTLPSWRFVTHPGP
jgi:hypothetical protein